MVSLDFNDLNPIELPVTLGTKRYVLREAGGGDAIEYRNAQLRATRLGPNGKPVGLDGLADAESLLVSRCLYEAEPQTGALRTLTDGTPDRRYRVAEEQVRELPARVLKVLFAEAKRISQLDEGETVEALEKQAAEIQTRIRELRDEEGARKNGSPSGTAGSGTPPS